MSGNEVLLFEVVTAVELLFRWPGLLEIELSQMIANRQPPPLWLRKIQISDDGKKVYVCDEGGDGNFPYMGVVFREEDVKRLEEQNPRLKWPVVERNEQPRPLNDWNAESEWISCSILPDRFGWSPFDVLDLLMRGELRYRSSTNNKISNISELRLAEVYRAELFEWEAKNVVTIRNVLVQDEVKARLHIESDFNVDNTPRLNEEGLGHNAVGNHKVLVSAGLFTGQNPQAARDALKASGYGDEVIAFILVEKLKATKELTGKLLEPIPNSVDKIKKHKEKDPKTYRERTNKLLSIANNLEIIIQ
jgi:hypothetical protein